MGFHFVSMLIVLSFGSGDELLKKCRPPARQFFQKTAFLMSRANVRQFHRISDSLQGCWQDRQKLAMGVIPTFC